MFVFVNAEFGFTTQPLPMFIAINIEFSCTLQPNSAFNSVNIDFGFSGWRDHLGYAHAP